MGYDDRFAIGGSNDGLEWTWFGSFTMGPGVSFTCPFTGNAANLVKNFDGTSITQNSGYYYNMTSISSVTQTSYTYGVTAHWTNSQGYLMYRVMWLDGGGATTTTDNVKYYRMSVGEIEWA
jgi:hypothetical protein